MLPARVSFGRLVEATAGRIAAAGAMLAAAAVLVLASGGPGVFGPLGSVISGHGARSATESAAVTGSASSPIVATPAGSALGLPGGGGAERSSPGRGDPGGRRSPSGGRTPSTGLPTIPVAQGGGGGGAGPSQPPGSPSQPAPPPSQGGQAIDAAGNTVEQVGHQAPAAQPITDPVGRLTHQVADTCRRLPVCP